MTEERQDLPLGNATCIAFVIYILATLEDVLVVIGKGFRFVF